MTYIVNVYFSITHCGFHWLQSSLLYSHQQQHMSSHMLEEHRGKLEQLHRPVLEQGHKLELVEVPACRLVLGQGQVQGHIEGQQRPQPREKTKQ